MTFRDERSHTSQHVGVTLEGEPSHYVVSTAPLLQAEGRTSHVIEMALDVTEIHRLEEKLSQENRLRETLVESSLDAMSSRSQPPGDIFNRAAGALGLCAGQVVGHRLPAYGPDAAQGSSAGTASTRPARIDVTTATSTRSRCAWPR
jgi:hypothetical protein